MPKVRLHATMHVVVENQLAAGDPPEARATLERLIGEGLSRHEAVHALMNAVSQQMVELLGEGRTFDRTRFAELLAALDADAYRGSAP